MRWRSPPPPSPPSSSSSFARTRRLTADGDGERDRGVDDHGGVLAHGVDDARARTDKDDDTHDDDDVIDDDDARRTTRTTRGDDDDDGVGRERGFSRVGSGDEEPEAYGY